MSQTKLWSRWQTPARGQNSVQEVSMSASGCSCCPGQDLQPENKWEAGSYGWVTNESKDSCSSLLQTLDSSSDYLWRLGAVLWL